MRDKNLKNWCKVDVSRQLIADELQILYGMMQVLEK